MSFPYDESFYCEEYSCQLWEAYCKDYAAVWFIRYEILESPLYEDAKEPCAPREKEVDVYKRQGGCCALSRKC